MIAFGQGGATETILPGDPGQVGTGLFFDQQTPSSLAELIRQLEAHPDWFSASLARQQAERFTVEHFEREMMEYLEEVCSMPCAAG